MYILLFILVFIIGIGCLAVYYYRTRRYNGYLPPDGDVYVNFV